MGESRLILDRYEPLGTAGAGGFGTVRIAWDQRIQRKVAIKTIQLSELDAWRAGLPGANAVAGARNAMPSTADRWHGVQPWSDYLADNGTTWPGEVAAKGFTHGELGPDDIDHDESTRNADDPFTALAHVPGLDEARTAAKLQDPRIVGVFDFEVRDQTAYLIMEYVEGITLTRLLARYENYLTLDVVAAVFDAVAGALSVAHRAGVLHLDIKPDNILINAQGQAKVTDFGLATLADASGTGLAGGGTIGYMPLEQMRREPLDARTDEWALAAMTYEMLTGDNPFHADSLEHAESAIEDAELVLPSLCWDNLDEQADDVVFYALDPDHDERYASVADFAEEMDKFLGDATAGKRQLAVIVSDALGIHDDDEQEQYDELGEYDEDGSYDANGYEVDDGRGGSRTRASRPGMLERVRDRLAEDPDARSRTIRAAVRAAIAALAFYLGFTALQVIYPIAPLFGKEAAFTVALTGALVTAIVAAALPQAGILIACTFAGFELFALGQVATGAVLIGAAIAWCYAFSTCASRRTRPATLTLATAGCIVAVVAVIFIAHLPQRFLAPCIAACASFALCAFLRK